MTTRKFRAMDFTKAVAATYTVVSIAAVSGVSVLDIVLDGVAPQWYWIAPLGGITLFSVPLAIHAAGRAIAYVSGPAPITVAGPTTEGRRIPISANGGHVGDLLTSLAPNIFAQPQPVAIEAGPPVYHWRVPLENGKTITVDEETLRGFITRSHKRRTFGRGYWLRYMSRDVYDACIEILVNAGMIENRKGGASGRLVTTPTHVLRHLKSRSSFKL